MTAPYSPTVITEAGTAGRRSLSGAGGPRGLRGVQGFRDVLSRQPLLLAGLGSATISASPVLVVLSAASPVATAFYRSLIALPVLVVLAMIERRKHGAVPLRRRLMAASGGVFLAVDLILWTHAIADIGAGVATVLGNLQVLIIAGMSWLIWKERLSRAVLIALPVVMIGVVLVSGLVGKPVAGQHPLAGIIYGLAMSIAYAAFLMMLRQSSAASPHVATPVADSTAGATLTAGLIGLAFGGLGLHPLWPAIGWLSVLGLVSQVAGWLLIVSSMPKLPSVVSSLMLLLQPAASLGLAALIIGERPTLLQILGAFLTCVGALAASLATTRDVDKGDHAALEAAASVAPPPAATTA
ncbi:MAG TPA: DMT family transporter [Streptosporangiaceae bacterium]|nr:DMT family transporter [Streptosporangiaceae bacterium]